MPAQECAFRSDGAGACGNEEEQLPISDEEKDEKSGTLFSPMYQFFDNSGVCVCVCVCVCARARACVFMCPCNNVYCATQLLEEGVYGYVACMICAPCVVLLGGYVRYANCIHVLTIHACVIL